MRWGFGLTHPWVFGPTIFYLQGVIMTSNNTFSDTVYRSDRYLGELFKLLPRRIGQSVDLLYSATSFEREREEQLDSRVRTHWRMCRATFTNFSVNWESGRSRPDYIALGVDKASKYAFDLDQNQWFQIEGVESYNTDFFVGGYSMRSLLYSNSDPHGKMLKVRFEQPVTRWDCPGKTTVTFGTPTTWPLEREPWKMA